MESSGRAAVAQLRVAVDELLELNLTLLPSTDVLDLVREMEVEVRRLAAVDQRNLAELEQRHLAAEMRVRDTRALLIDMLRIDPHEAKRRVELARDLGPRRTLTGEALDPIFPAVAAAVASGEVSLGHAQKIVQFTEQLPPHIDPPAIADLQALLLDTAAHTYPANVGARATALLAHIDQDGTEPRDEALQRRRSFTLYTGSDGWSKASGFLSPRLTAVVKTVLDSLAAPAPAEDRTPDPRSHAQRCHDGLQDALERVLRSGDLPDVGGAPVTILVTVQEGDLRRRVGHAVTAHGDLLPIKTLVAMAGDAELIPTYLNDTGGIMAYGRAKRLATPAQRRALAARDGGCSRPGCTAPPGWCEAHHVLLWSEGGGTDLSNMTLVCPRDHRLLDSGGTPADKDVVGGGGWECVMQDGVPYWRPPTWIDPDRHPRRNIAHHHEPRFSEQTERGR